MFLPGDRLLTLLLCLGGKRRFIATICTWQRLYSSLCLLSIWLWSLCFMVTAVALVFFLLLFTVLALTFYPLLPFIIFFPLSVALWYGFCSGNPGGWRSFILHDVMQQPDNPKTVLLFFITTSFTSYLWTLIPTFWLPCSPILYILFAAKAAALLVCLFCDHKRCPNISFPTSGLGGFLFLILCYLLYPVPPGTGFSDSHHSIVNGQWLKIASMRRLGFGSGGWLLSICPCTSYSIPRL